MDRTDRIPLIEDVGKHLLFLRPRRFGKSMLLSMLENYYDVARADAFETLFGHLAIGRNPTDLHNQYFILKWDFSAVDPQGEPKEIRDNLHCYINERIENFSASYQGMLPQKIRIRAENAMSSFQSLLTAIRQTPRKLYLLVDEYDNFANELMMGSREISADRYKSLVYGEGCLKAIFKVVKAATAGEGLDRAFITGVSPVVMSGITSGHNIAKNVYLRPEFNDLCGFWESEIREVLGRIAEKCGLSGAQAGEALDMMRCFYNGYAFTYEQKPLVYNPTLAIYFLEHFQDYCGYPRRILDSNLAMDRGKITYISRLPHGEEVILNALSDETPLIIQDIADRFGVEDMLTVTKDTEFMASLLYFFGVLTLTDQQTALGELTMKVPNLVVRKLYAERIQEMFLPEFRDKEDARQVSRTFYQTGDLQPLCDFMERRYLRVFDNRDYRWANELTVKTAFLTLLFNDTFYIMDSEPALDRKYADMTMIVRPDMRQFQLLDFLLEFKFVGMGKHKLSGEQVREMSQEELLVLPPVREKLDEAKKNLAAYQDTLEDTYGDMLRLHVYSVVAVGFERIVWEAVD